MHKLIAINGVDLTPFLSMNGYMFQCEELEKRADRSVLDGSLLRNRLGRFATIELTFLNHLPMRVIKMLHALQDHTTVQAEYLNYNTGELETGEFYVKIKSPVITYIKNNEPQFKSFSMSLKATRRYAL